MKVDGKNPIQMNIPGGVLPGDKIKCSFVLMGDRTKDGFGGVEVNFVYHVKYRKTFTTRKVNMIDILESNKISLKNSRAGDDKRYDIELVVPNYDPKVVVSSCLYIYLQPPIYGKEVYIDQLVVNKITGNENNSTESSSSTESSTIATTPTHTSEVKTENVGNVNNRQIVDKVIMVSHWGVMCGIAIYTKDLIDELNRLGLEGKIEVNPLVSGKLEKGILFDMYKNRTDKNGGCVVEVPKLIHLQNETGIMSDVPKFLGNNIIGNLGSSVVITWHTIGKDIEKYVKKFEKELNVRAHILPCEGALEYFTGRPGGPDICVIPLGSKLIYDTFGGIGGGIISTDEARTRLRGECGWEGCELGWFDKPVAFVFGFASQNKKYDEMIDAARSAGIHLVISGSIHSCGYSVSENGGVINDDNVTVLGRHLSDEEIDLWALASDLLLFDYEEQPHYSSSAALHRIVGAGKPIICCRTRHFNDIEEIGYSGVSDSGSDSGYCLKFGEKDELVEKISEALSRREDLGNRALEYARRTSSEEVAKRHLEIYRKYVQI